MRARQLSPAQLLSLLGPNERLSQLEMLFKGIPLLASDLVLICDRGYVREMEKRGLAETVGADFDGQLARMLESLSTYRRTSDLFREENCFKSYQESREFVCDLILGSQERGASL